MTDPSYMRQLGFFDPSQHTNAHTTIVGLGGIGSFAAVSLAKLGIPTLSLIDFDNVEAHNVPNQFYSTRHVGLPKALALADTCESYGAIDCIPIPMSFSDALTDDYSHSEVIISGLDSMAARLDVWSQVKMKPATKLYLDARIAGQLILVYAVNPMDITSIDSYEATLHSDDEALPAPCTERGVIDVGMTVGGILTRLVRSYYAADDIDPVTVFNLESLTLNHGEWVL